MSDEEMNKKMEFIVEQQAKFASDIEMMREVHATNTTLLKDSLLGVVEIVGNLARLQMRTEDSVNSLSEDFSRLTQVQARTEERLNIFINVVERFISGNGGAESSA